MSVEIRGPRPRLDILPNGKRQLVREFRISVDNTLYVIPEGFITDLSSYPWWARWIVRFDKVDIAGIVHDWLYVTGVGTRKQADAVWRKIAMAGEKHATGVQAWVSWGALRVGAWPSYLKYKNARSSWRN